RMGTSAGAGSHSGAAAEARGGAVGSRDGMAGRHAGRRRDRDVLAALVSVLDAALAARGGGGIRAALDGELGPSPRSAPDLEQDRQGRQRRTRVGLSRRAPAAALALHRVFSSWINGADPCDVVVAQK